MAVMLVSSFLSDAARPKRLRAPRVSTRRGARDPNRLVGRLRVVGVHAEAAHTTASLQKEVGAARRGRRGRRRREVNCVKSIAGKNISHGGVASGGDNAQNFDYQGPLK
jgi:hypothetical protein